MTRRDDPDDARGAVIALTDEGWRTIRAAAPHHVESVRRRFIDLLTPEQIDALADISWTVVAHLTEVESRDEGAPPR